MTTAVKRACDACHRRKVKCDGINPCRNCSTAQLACTYNAIPQKKGPKGSRAKVISELRETQRQTSLSAQVQNRMNGIVPPATNPSLAPTPGLLSGEMVKECLDFFFAHMYSQIPILSRHRLEQQAVYMDQSLDTYCLLTALAAFVMIQPGMGMPGGDPYGLDTMPGANIVSSTVLMEEAIRVRKGYDYTETPSLNTLCTSYFLFACYSGLEMHEKAWFHLREAATMIHIIGMNREETYAQFEPVESCRRRRLYWLLFVTERAYALHRNRPLTLQATINPPTLADDPTDPYAQHLNSFVLVVSLFRPFDDAFVAVWNKTRNSSSAAHLHALQKQLSDILPSFLTYGDSQLADLRSNQQWLKTMNWQMNVAGDESLVYQQYAANLSNSLVPGGQPSETHTGSLLTKLFDVACALTDVLAIHPASRDPFSPGPREQLNPLLNILSMLRNGDHRFMPLLLSKVHEVLPKLANPMLQNVPENVANNACNVDIFDGFGNAGMVDEYDKKFSSTDSSSSQGGTSHSPFVSSPPAMSPGGDYAQGLQNNSYNPMSEVMMPSTNPSQTTHSQHQLRQSISSLHNINTHLQNGMANPMEQNMDHQSQTFGQSFNQGMAQNMPFGINGIGQMGRQPPARANSFGIPGNFHSLQRNNSDMSTMTLPHGISVTTDMDFNTLR